MVIYKRGLFIESGYKAVMRKWLLQSVYSKSGIDC